MPVRKQAEAVNTPHRRQAALGAVMGLLVGEALGRPLTGKKGQVAAFPTLCQGPARDLPAPLAAGPSTELAGCLATSLRTLRSFDTADVRLRYLACVKGLKHPDSVTVSALNLSIPSASTRVWQTDPASAATAGALARTAPLGIFFWDPTHTAIRLQASLSECALTHWDPTCQLSSAAFNAALACLVEKPSAPSIEVVESAATALTLAATLLGRQHPDFLRSALPQSQALKRDLALSREEDPLLYGPELHFHQASWGSRLALRLAFWELAHAPSFAEGLIDVVNRGGAAGLHGAIAGALLGAAYGLDKIPSRWTEPALALIRKSPTHAGRELISLAESVT